MKDIKKLLKCFVLIQDKPYDTELLLCQFHCKSKTYKENILIDVYFNSYLSLRVLPELKIQPDSCRYVSHKLSDIEFELNDHHF